MVVNAMEAVRLRALHGLDVHLVDEFGLDELVAAGCTSHEIRDRVVLRAVEAFRISSASVPETFPVHLADLLRAEGVELTADRELFDDRRRVKSAAEVAGIRRAQRAAEAGMTAARDLLRRAEAGPGGLFVDGEPLTVEGMKVAISQAFVQHGASGDEFIVAHGGQAAVGHDMGSGRIGAGETVIVDLWPRDVESACFADMTRTFVVGEIPEQVAVWHRLCKEALDVSFAAVRPGAGGRAIFDAVCDLFERAAEPTQRTKEPGVALADGFFHGLGHGVGLDVHEEPGLGLTSHDELREGDVVTLEPGLYREGYGGVRLEDLVLVTASGAENLTDFPYDLTP